jgi:uncharacterized protein YprB with RNaseH-like and TPR domain
MSLRQRLAGVMGTQPAMQASGAIIDASPPVAQPLPETASRTDDDNAVVSAFRDRITRLRRASAEAGETLQSLPGAAVVGADGQAFVRIDRSLDEMEPAVEIFSKHWQPRHVTALSKDARLCGLDPHRALFLDTETTGLGGTSSIVFLIGAISFADGRPKLTQFLLPQLSAEPHMLSHLVDFVSEFDFLVTYNGRAFDVKALNDRFVLSRLRHAIGLLEDKPHVDLLYPSRRIWRMCFSDCRLLTLEREVLGRQRGRDVEGADIPRIYYRYLQTGQTAEMADVVAHNEHDLISLLLMASMTLQMVAEPGAVRPEDAAIVAADDDEGPMSLSERTRRRRALADRMLGLGTLLLAAGDHDGGAAALSRSLSSPSAVTRYQARKQLAALHKKRGALQEAQGLWQQMADENCLGDLHPLIELARYHEHELRDFNGALGWVDRALEHPAARLSDVRERLTQRRERLLRRLMARPPRRRKDPLG